MVPDFDDNEQSDLETDRVVHFVLRCTAFVLVAGFLILLVRLFTGCTPTQLPPQDAGKCSVVVVQGVDAGAHDSDWGY